jgi:hypothetical protein
MSILLEIEIRRLLPAAGPREIRDMARFGISARVDAVR